MEIPPGRDSHQLQLPVWNALYQVRDFVQFMDNISAKDPSGRPLVLTQINQSRWLLRDAKPGARIDYEMYSDDPPPFGAELTKQHAFFNLAQILVYADDTRGDSQEIEFRDLPQGWKIATSLEENASRYLAKSYDALVDAPVEIGRFEEKDFAGTCGHYRVVIDAADTGPIFDKILPPIKQIVNTASAWMNDCPFHSYTFIFHFTDSSGGGMEHAYSTAITVPYSRVKDDLEGFAGITAHEFFHLWDVKRIRPQSLEPVDYTKENYTPALWFSEGADTTGADCIRLRAGLIDAPHYLDRLSQAITELENRPAHLTQSVEQSSIDAWLEKYPYFGLPDRSISYYNKGDLLGVLLDLKMREVTHGRESLQTLFQWMNTHYAKQGKFFPDSDGVRNAAEKLTGADFHEFFADYVSGVKEIPWDSFFAYVGLRASSVQADFVHRGFDVVQKFDQPPTVVRVQPGSEADRAGLKPDDIIVSVNGTAAGRGVEQLIEALGPGTVLHLRIRRDGAPQELQWTLGARKMTIYRLQDLPGITSEQRSARRSWLYLNSNN
jgi:predicted metalloprotease with PDZ domain